MNSVVYSCEAGRVAGRFAPVLFNTGISSSIEVWALVRS